jgi:hypothetical protein
LFPAARPSIGSLSTQAAGNTVHMTPRNDDDRSESDVDEDEKVAASRTGKEDEDDGTYVGQTASDDSLDASETGAEARGEKGDR